MPELLSQMLITSSKPLLMTQDVVQVREVTSPRWAYMWLTLLPVSTSHRQMAPSWPPLASTIVCKDRSGSGTSRPSKQPHSWPRRASTSSFWLKSQK